jgi:hypothetical protein
VALLKIVPRNWASQTNWYQISRNNLCFIDSARHTSVLEVAHTVQRILADWYLTLHLASQEDVIVCSCCHNYFVQCNDTRSDKTRFQFLDVYFSKGFIKWRILLKVKGKLVSVFKHHAVKTWGQVDIQFQAFLISAVDRGGWWGFSPLYPRGKRPWCPLDRRLCRSWIRSTRGTEQKNRNPNAKSVASNFIMTKLSLARCIQP